jgi:hypothetical protein
MLLVPVAGIDINIVRRVVCHHHTLHNGEQTASTTTPKKVPNIARQLQLL